jgi:hypothetical protein
MMPQGTRVLRREQRHAWRGMSGGRRVSHQVQVTCGRATRAASPWPPLRAIKDQPQQEEAAA